MANWYNLIKQDLKNIIPAMEFFEKEITEAEEDVKIKGRLLDTAAQLSGIFEYRFSQLQQIEAILKYLEILLDEEESKLYQKYNEGYQRMLSESAKHEYIKGEPTYSALKKYIIDISYVRNQYIAISKALDVKNFMISNITKLKTAGVDDFEV